MKIKEAIILAGGMGTRLRSIISEIPKPLAPINGIPFLTYLLKYLSHQAVERVILSVGYKWEMIHEIYKDRFEGMDILYAIEKEPLGTGGAIALALTKAKDDNVIILNGDSFIKLNIDSFSNFHHTTSSKLSFALKEMENFDRYGIVEIEGDIITAFREKSFREKGLINAGVYIAKRDIFEDKNLPEKFSFEQDFLEKEVYKRGFYGYKSQGYFIDIGIPEDYNRAEKELISEINNKEYGI